MMPHSLENVMSKFEFRTFFVYGKVLKANEWTETSFGPVQFIELEINGELHKAISPAHTFPPGMIQYFIGKEIAVMKMATAEDFKDGIFAVVDWPNQRTEVKDFLLSKSITLMPKLIVENKMLKSVVDKTDADLINRLFLEKQFRADSYDE